MQIKIEIQERWHVGSGFGDGPGADALVVKTAEKLPYLPGKTLKGLMRDACRLTEDLGHLRKGTTDRLFGASHSESLAEEMKFKEDDHGTKRFVSSSGSLDIRSAFLGHNPQEQSIWRNWASKNPSDTRHLFDTLHSTSIGKEGVAEPKSLRSFEFAVPATLYAELVVSEDDVCLIERFLPMIRELGVRRKRGFGRCSMTMMNEVA